MISGAIIAFAGSLLVGICEALVTANINCFGKFKRIFMIKTQKYVRKPLYVDVVRVTEENFEEVAQWCQGNIETETEPKGPDERSSFVSGCISPSFRVRHRRSLGIGCFTPRRATKSILISHFRTRSIRLILRTLPTDDSQSEQLIAHPELACGSSDPDGSRSCGSRAGRRSYA
jgi:hypothetical protein